MTGSRFAANEQLELFFDTTDEISALTDGSGVFTSSLLVPISAIAGSHWVTAVDPSTALAAQARYDVFTPWTQFHAAGDHVGLNAQENVLAPSDVPSLSPLWTAETGGPIAGGPAVSALGSVFVGSGDGTLYVFPKDCLDPCAPAWSLTTGGAVSSTPALASNVGYVGSADGTLYAFKTSCRTASCGPIWTGLTGGPITTSPTLSSNVYVGSDDGSLYAFGASGCGAPQCSPMWAFPTGGPITGSPAVAAGKVVVGSGDGNVYAVDSTGTLKWVVDLGSPVTASPAIGPGVKALRVFVGTQSGQLFGLNLSTGAVEFTGQAGGAIESSPAVAYGNAYVGSDDGKLNAFSTTSCRKNCTPAWTGMAGGAVTSSPAVADGVVYVGAMAGGAYAFNARSGAALWNWMLPQPVRSSPAVADGHVYIGDDAGNVYAFQLSPPPEVPPKPDPATLAGLPTPIRHVVIVYQENQSFDGVLGALCVQDQRCDGAASGTLADGTTIPLAVAPDIVPEAGHTQADQTLAVDGGKMDGFSLIRGCDSSTGYACYMEYQPDAIPNLAALARSFVISDRTFETGSHPSWGAHLDLAAAQTDGFTGDNPQSVPGVGQGPDTWGCDSNSNATWVSPSGTMLSVPSCVPRPDGSGPYVPSPVPWVPTIMDRLDAAGMSWRIYGGLDRWTVCPSFSDCIYGPERGALVRDQQVLTDAAQGRLPNLSIVIPSFANSQHNLSSMLLGDNWIGSVVGAIENGPQWGSTAVFVAYDDCGCFYDHVPPPPDLGIRVPMVIVSPYARPAYTDSNVASYSSMLAYTEHVFGLESLYSTDAGAYDYAQSFDYSQTPVPPVPLGTHPLPRWERRWLKEHPPAADAT